MSPSDPCVRWGPSDSWAFWNASALGRWGLRIGHCDSLNSRGPVLEIFEAWIHRAHVNVEIARLLMPARFLSVARSMCCNRGPDGVLLSPRRPNAFPRSQGLALVDDRTTQAGICSFAPPDVLLAVGARVEAQDGALRIPLLVKMVTFPSWRRFPLGCRRVCAHTGHARTLSGSARAWA